MRRNRGPAFRALVGSVSTRSVLPFLRRSQKREGEPSNDPNGIGFNFRPPGRIADASLSRNSFLANEKRLGGRNAKLRNGSWGQPGDRRGSGTILNRGIQCQPTLQ